MPAQKSALTIQLVIFPLYERLMEPWGGLKPTSKNKPGAPVAAVREREAGHFQSPTGSRHHSTETKRQYQESELARYTFCDVRLDV